MAIRLVKIAKELNVGTSTIVDFLKGKGFEIENKPTAKISEEMHNELLSEYSNSMAVKEKADQLVIGSRYENQEETPVAPIIRASSSCSRAGTCKRRSRSQTETPRA